MVNSPELTKGEETGFEFVHKSFAEFLVAERFADLVEKVTFKAPEYGSDAVTWRMSEQDAARELAPMFAIRLIPDEVQEMLEPMLGCFIPFSKGERVDEVVAASARKEGLIRIIDRFEAVLADFLRGASLETVGKIFNMTSRVQSSLEAYANYCAGILIIGAAASRQLRQFTGKDKKQHRLFSAEPFRGAFWRSLCILSAGGILLDERLANRLFDGIHVLLSDSSSSTGDLESPLKLGFLHGIEGYRSNLRNHLLRCLEATSLQERINFVLQILVQATGAKVRSDEEPTLFEDARFRARNFRLYAAGGSTAIGEMIHEMADHGIAPMELRHAVEQHRLDHRRLIEETIERLRHGENPHEVLRRAIKDGRHSYHLFEGDYPDSFMKSMEMSFHDIERVFLRSSSDKEGFIAKLFGKW